MVAGEQPTEQAAKRRAKARVLIVVIVVVVLIVAAVLASVTVLKPNRPPHIEVTSYFEALVGTTVSFNVTTAVDPDGDALNFTWDFGDVSTAYARNVSHTYATHGDYTWQLTVDDGHGHVVTGTGSIMALASHDFDIGVNLTGRCHWDARFTDYPYLNVTVWNNASFVITLARATFALKNAAGAWFFSIDSPVPSNYSTPVVTLYPGTNTTWILIFQNQASGEPVLLDYNSWFQWPLHWTGG
jgi:PKD repeat protein